MTNQAEGAVRPSERPELDCRRALPVGRTALIIAGTHLLLGSLYIAISTTLAGELSLSLAELQRVELIKGVLYITVTSLVLFLAARIVATRMAADAEKLAQHREALLDADRRAHAGLLAAAVAHDVNNLLMAVLGSARFLEGEMRDSGPEAREALDDLVTAAERMVSLVRRVKEAAASGAPKAEATDVVAILRESLAVVRRHPEAAQCSLEVDLPPELVWPVRRYEIEQIIDNLVVNAAQAMDGAGPIRISAGVEGDKLQIRVDDAGPGVPRELHASIFEPRSTTKATGTGLGLMSVRAAALSHGGDASVSASPLGGARFTVSLSRPASG